MEIWDEMWEKICKALYEEAEKVCGKSKGGHPRKKEMWWWENEVQMTIREKKKGYKALRDGLANENEYKKWKREAKERAWKD